MHRSIGLSVSRCEITTQRGARRQVRTGAVAYRRLVGWVVGHMQGRDSEVGVDIAHSVNGFDVAIGGAGHGDQDLADGLGRIDLDVLARVVVAGAVRGAIVVGAVGGHAGGYDGAQRDIVRSEHLGCHLVLSVVHGHPSIPVKDHVARLHPEGDRLGIFKVESDVGGCGVGPIHGLCMRGREERRRP